MLSSRFAAILPGEGTHSYRLYEALQAGAIPVLLGLSARPLEPLVDWPSIAVVHEDTSAAGLEYLAARLRLLPAETAARPAAQQGEPGSSSSGCLTLCRPAPPAQGGTCLAGGCQSLPQLLLGLALLLGELRLEDESLILVLLHELTLLLPRLVQYTLQLTKFLDVLLFGGINLSLKDGPLLLMAEVSLQIVIAVTNPTRLL
jgi:hypothetical protein